MPNQAIAVERPTIILKQAWAFCRKDLKKLGLIYLIFNLPLVIISFFPVANISSDQKLNFAQILGFIFSVIVNSWGHITLLLSAHKVTGDAGYSIGQSIKEAKNFLLKYLALILSVALIVSGFIILAGVSATIMLPFLLKINRILSIVFGSFLLITVIVLLVFYILRWSLSALTCVFENLQPIAALKLSFSLINQHINTVVGVYGLIILIYIAGLFPVMLMGIWGGLGQSSNSPFNLVATIYTTFINIVFVPFWTMATVVLYKKLKEVL